MAARRLRLLAAGYPRGPVHFSELTAPEQRVLGCLIEKRWTTPDQYPLSLNALRLACNQSTNRDPVTQYDEHTVREAAQRLSKYGLARLASGHSSRAIKYRHLAEEALRLGREELAVLCVLLLRGAQTPGELKGRSERMAHFDSLEELDLVLDSLSEHGYVRRIDRRPGQKEDRFMHLLGGESGESADTTATPSAVASAPPAGAAPPDASSRGASPAAAPSPAAAAAAAGPQAAPPPAAPAPAPGTPSFTAPAPSGGPDGALERRVAALESEVAALRAELAELRGSGGERETHDVGGAADDHTREGHLEAR
jgi:uncharacterized protein